MEIVITIKTPEGKSSYTRFVPQQENQVSFEANLIAEFDRVIEKNSDFQSFSRHMTLGEQTPAQKEVIEAAASLTQSLRKFASFWQSEFSRHGIPPSPPLDFQREAYKLGLHVLQTGGINTLVAAQNYLPSELEIRAFVRPVWDGIVRGHID